MSGLANLASLVEAATPGPWVECGADRGGCQCGNVWSTPADAPVGRVISDKDLYEAGWIRKDPNSRLADARMFAAAPDLAALLIECEEALRRAYPYVMDALREAEATTPATAYVVRDDLEQSIVPALARLAGFDAQLGDRQ